jgi:hypothetical protein
MEAAIFNDDDFSVYREEILLRKLNYIDQHREKTELELIWSSSQALFVLMKNHLKDNFYFWF